MIYFIIVVAVIILILILNYLIYRRSIITTAVEIGIRFFTPFKKRNLEKQIARKNKLIAKGYKPPKLKCNIKKEMFDGMEVYILSSNEKQSNKVIFYLYGGCYVSLPIYFHWKFLDRLVRKTGTTLILPIYPLAPECKCEETISKVNSLYLEVCKLCNKNIILMGDSSGGGLSILTYVNATKNNIKKVVLF